MKKLCQYISKYMGVPAAKRKAVSIEVGMQNSGLASSLPKFYTFPSKDAKERILYNNFTRVDQEVRDMIREIQAFKVKK